MFAGSLTRKNYQLQNLDCQFSLENQKFDLRKLFMRDGRGELFATGNWNLATGEKNFQVRSGLDPAKLLANDSRFPWAKELIFDAPPEIELSGVARPDGHLQVLGKLNFDQFSVREREIPEHESRVLEIGRFLDDHERAGDPSVWNTVRRCLESTRRFSDADQFRVKSHRANATLPAEISARIDRLGISDVAGDPGHGFRGHQRIREVIGDWTSLAWQNKISRCTPELSFNEFRAPEQCRPVRSNPGHQGRRHRDRQVHL